MVNTQPSGTRIGIVGAGLLGSALTKRLIEQSFEVSVYDIDEGAVRNAVASGAHGCSKAAELFDTCGVVFLCLPTSDIVARLLDDVEQHLQLHHVLLDATTSEPSAMIENAARADSRGATYLEANVAGSSQQLRQGDAALFLAGSQEHITQLQPMLNAVASQQYYLGAAGSAAKMKLVHNLVLGLNRSVLAEALCFARAMGLDMQLSLDLLRETPAYSKVMDVKGAKMVSADYEPQAKLSQHLKDVQIIIDEAARAGALAPLSAIHETLLNSAVSRGFAEADNSAIIEAFRPESDED